jgi:hypothetical protein
MTTNETLEELQRTLGTKLPPVDARALPRRVILESPYAGDVDRNVRYARAALRDSLRRGEAPIASHLLYTQENVLDDGDAHERRLGMRAGFSWIPVAEATVVYTDLGLSNGMRSGISRAATAGNPIEFRSIPDWEDPPEERRAPPSAPRVAPRPVQTAHEPHGASGGPRARAAAPARAASMPRAPGARGAR